MVSNQGAFWILSSIAFETVKNQTEEKQKNKISAILFSLSNFSKSWKIRNRFLAST